ncbi:MAG TPA: metal ABC transporter ATP-binding protein [Anaeromyxobacteraceae bacterium]|nr:metal ABC transporter ATP-binding protein [Anaeromyxobacteraceae bacterium]
MTTTDVLVALRDATVGYPGAPILQGVELEVRRGDFVTLVGPNGGGKTTVVRSLLGALPLLAGRRETPGPVRVGYVPQRDHVDTFWPLTVADVAIMGRFPLLGAGRRPGPADREAVRHALGQVGIAELAARPFGELSGGQRQRTLIARALAAVPELLVLDEPTNGMDPAAELETMDILRTLHGGGRLAIVMVSHRLGEVANLARTLAFVDKDAALFRVGSLEEMLQPDALGALYGRPVAVREAEGRRWVYPLAHGEGEGR